MSFYDDVISKATQFNYLTSVRELALLEPITRAAVLQIIEMAGREGIELHVSETYRSRERQQQLFVQGATQLKDVGVHHWGLACDFYKVVDGVASWNGNWAFLGRLCARVGMVWGGDWGVPLKLHTFVDQDHVQRIAVSDQERLFAGTWYPDETYRVDAKSVT